MATLTDLSFETSDGAGGAASWIFLSQASVVTYLAFRISPTDSSLLSSIESFEGDWTSTDDFLFAFADYSVVSDSNDILPDAFSVHLLPPGIPFESFEVGWSSNERYETSSAPFTSIAFTGGAGDDSFESGWSNSTYVYALTSIPGSGYVGNPPDSFEVDWFTGDYVSSSDDVDWTTFSVNGQFGTSAEDFATILPDQAFTAAASSTTLSTANSHGLVAGDRVLFYATTPSSSLPPELVESVTYYVVSVPELTTFEVSLTSDGSAIEMSAATIGVCNVTDPYEYWTEINPVF